MYKYIPLVSRSSCFRHPVVICKHFKHNTVVSFFESFCAVEIFFFFNSGIKDLFNDFYFKSLSYPGYILFFVSAQLHCFVHGHMYVHDVCLGTRRSLLLRQKRLHHAWISKSLLPFVLFLYLLLPILHKVV